MPTRDDVRLTTVPVSISFIWDPWLCERVFIHFLLLWALRRPHFWSSLDIVCSVLRPPLFPLLQHQRT
ncbi:hypothetical protein Y1Q_0001509 [Alligator mississippiensis]|uniref:Uncharacterized protein n=1 Tax=Alligator mississippiensis TaxID=8496 RepID=A0A151M9P4_ALLMI|nr:hypothetical protein Y1Q_0001509 [Alligator mississippiensis]